MNSYKVIVVIPIYKLPDKVYEIISLKQVMKVLKKHTICFLIPERMREDFIHPAQCVVESFQDRYFTSRESYSNLLLSVEFYDRFCDYDYMLLYQLDAFVFCDQLIEFCNMEYDYIGAPWPFWFRPDYQVVVGNGGFSLRRIASCRRVVLKKQVVEDKIGKEKFLKIIKSEDNYFAMCGAINYLKFKVPCVTNALQFSVEWNISKSYERLKSISPFGCHGWQRDSYKYWRNLIIKEIKEPVLIQALDEEIRKLQIGGYSYDTTRRNIMYFYLHDRAIKYGCNDKMKYAWHTYHGSMDNYSIWGAGVIGEKCIKFFNEVNSKINIVFDEKIIMCCTRQSVLPVPEEINKVRGGLIITTTRHEKEISQKLKDKGWVKNIDYFLYYEMICGFYEWYREQSCKM